MERWQDINENMPPKDMAFSINKQMKALFASLGAWADWQPTVTYSGGTTNPTSYTVAYARYARLGKLVHFAVNISFVKGSGNRTEVDISLPAARAFATLAPFTGRKSLTTGAVAAAYSDDTALIKVPLDGAMSSDGYIAIQGTYEAS